MPSSIPISNLEHWAILRRVVDCGSFAEAAQSLKRSQSAISYSVAKLQETLGFPLMEMQGRRAVLNGHGRQLLAEVSPLIDGLVSIETDARVNAGAGPLQIRLLVDTLFPKAWMAKALNQLSGAHPGVMIDLQETVREELRADGSRPYDLAISLTECTAIAGERLCDLSFVQVAHRDHPLANDAGPMTQAHAARHLRVAVRDLRSTDRDPSLRTGKVWAVASLESALASVHSGACFGWLPEQLITKDLQDGTLVALNIGATNQTFVSLDLVFHDAERANAPAHFLAKTLRDICEAEQKPA